MKAKQNTVRLNESHLSKAELAKMKISLKDYEFARLQFILQQFSELNEKDVNHRNSLWCRMVWSNWGVFYDSVVRQRGYLPEPKEVELKITLKEI